MYMSDTGSFRLVCVTNRHLCSEDVSVRIQALLTAGADMVILREKDLTETDYQQLAQNIFTDLPREMHSHILLHHFPDAAKALAHPSIHLSLWQLEARPEIRHSFSKLGISIHSAEEARRAEALGADYVTAGHIFDTACKQGLPGRGTAFLQEVCRSVAIPVFAIGGISLKNIRQISSAGAAGACIMSSGMQCEDPGNYFQELRRASSLL